MSRDRLFLCSWMLFLGFSSLNPALAQEPYFCENPYDAVCGEDAEIFVRTAIPPISNSMERPFSGGRRLEVAPSLDGFIEAPNRIANQFATTRPQASHDQVWIQYIDALESQIRPQFETSFQDARSAMARVVERLPLDAKSSLKLASQVQLREDHKRFVQGITPLSFGAVLRYLQQNGRTKLLQQMHDYCGEDGLKPGAGHFDELQGVLFCPAFFLSMHAENILDDEKVRAIIAVPFSHETAHGIETSMLFRPFISCARENYSTYVEPWSAGTVVRARRNVELQLTEILGDHFAVDTLVEELKSHPDPVWMTETLRRAYRPLCNRPEGGVRHPSGKFRIGTILGKNPRLRQLFGCPKKASPELVCDWQGLVPGW